MRRDNVILIGMPGVGKSTVGVVLAKRLGYQFVDSDICIQQEEGRLLHEIIEQEGLEGFLLIENRVNASFACKKHVIATGGSAIYGAESMEHLHKIGFVVYMKLPLEELSVRLGDLNKRGVALKEKQTLEDLYRERIPYYEQYADYIIDTSHLSIREIVAQISECYGT
ncbi:MAG: shikimate kinase [Eubacteriales bacterium]